jgi:RsmE family RNA methyltransferase
MKINDTIDSKTACKKVVIFFHRANILIGSENIFENEEIEFAKSLGIQTVTLGDKIFKIETAAITTSTLILNSFRAYVGTHK